MEMKQKLNEYLYFISKNKYFKGGKTVASGHTTIGNTIEHNFYSQQKKNKEIFRNKA